MVVFELGNFVYNTSDDEITIFFNILKMDVSVELLSVQQWWLESMLHQKEALSYAAVIIWDRFLKTQ